MHTNTGGPVFYPGSSLLNIYVRKRLMLQSKPHTRKGKLTIDGAYHPSVIQRAFISLGEFEIRQVNGWTEGKLSVVDQKTLSACLAFQVVCADCACICVHARVCLWHARAHTPSVRRILRIHA